MPLTTNFTNASLQNANTVGGVGDHAKHHNDLATAVNKAGQTTIARRAAGTENITNSTLTAGTWDTEIQDDGGWFTVGTPDRITVTETGVYIVAVHVAWDTSVTGDRYMHLERIRASDGVQEVIDATAVKATIVSEQEQTCVAVLPLSAGDAVRIKLFQNSGGTRTWGGQGRSSGNPVASSTVSEFTVTRIS